jgi:hypothetical protein
VNPRMMTRSIPHSSENDVGVAGGASLLAIHTEDTRILNGTSSSRAIMSWSRIRCALQDGDTTFSSSISLSLASVRFGRLVPVLA